MGCLVALGRIHSSPGLLTKMAQTLVHIANSALAACGCRRIVALTDPSREARACNDQIQASRKATLRMHKWNCATKRIVLTTVGLTPAFGFSYAHTLPDDFIRVHSVWDSGQIVDEACYRVEGLELLSNATELWLKYVYDLTQVTQFDPLLDEAVAYHLAWSIAPLVSASETKRTQLYEDWQDALKRARFADSTEDPAEELDADVWIRARTGVNSGFVRDPMT